MKKKPYYSISDLWQATALLNCLCLWSVWLRFPLVKPSTSQMSNNNVAIFHLEISVSPIRWSISFIHIITHFPMYFYAIQRSLWFYYLLIKKPLHLDFRILEHIINLNTSHVWPTCIDTFIKPIHPPKVVLWKKKKQLYSQRYKLRSFIKNIPLLMEIKFWKWSFHWSKTYVKL